MTDWHDESLQCCCHTSRSRLKLSLSLTMFTWLYLPWDPYKLCWKKNIGFFLKIFYFSMCLTSNKYVSEFALASWTVGELISSLFSLMSFNLTFPVGKNGNKFCNEMVGNISSLCNHLPGKCLLQLFWHQFQWNHHQWSYLLLKMHLLIIPPKSGSSRNNSLAALAISCKGL